MHLVNFLWASVGMRMVYVEFEDRATKSRIFDVFVVVVRVDICKSALLRTYTAPLSCIKLPGVLVAAPSPGTHTEVHDSIFIDDNAAHTQ